MQANSIRITHILLSLLLAVFFIYAGVKKFIPGPAKPANNEAFVKAFAEDKFENPVTFKVAVKALKTSGFLKMVGILQILSGLLILLPKTRLLGLLMLLPLTVNIFCFHFFMDNRPDENTETGVLLLLNMLLLFRYSRQLKHLFLTTWSYKIIEPAQI